MICAPSYLVLLFPIANPCLSFPMKLRSYCILIFSLNIAHLFYPDFLELLQYMLLHASYVIGWPQCLTAGFSTSYCSDLKEETTIKNRYCRLWKVFYVTCSIWRPFFTVYEVESSLKENQKISCLFNFSSCNFFLSYAALGTTHLHVSTRVFFPR